MNLVATVMILGALALPGLPNSTQLLVSQCDKRSDILEILARQFGEAPIGAGIASGYLLEIIVNQGTGSWTMIRTAPTGISCVVSAGHSWESMAYVAPGAAL